MNKKQGNVLLVFGIILAGVAIAIGVLMLERVSYRLQWLAWAVTIGAPVMILGTALFLRAGTREEKE